MRLVVLFYAILISLGTLAGTAAAERPVPPLSGEDGLARYQGRTFSAPGPNCFSTALKTANVTPYFRGMDEPEFSELIDLFCHVVTEPRRGDLGIFLKPGFGYIHAYLYVSEIWALQKPGVDYLGKTPISREQIANIKYIYTASPECRRYSQDISECSNQHLYLRCRPVEWMGIPAAASLDVRFGKIEAQQDHLLDATQTTESENAIFEEIVLEWRSLEQALAKESNLPAHLRPYFSARLKSLGKQNEFLAGRFGFILN